MPITQLQPFNLDSTSAYTMSQLTVTGNVISGNLNLSGNLVDTGALSIVTGSNGNLALAPNGTGIVTVSTALSAVGNITSGNLNAAGLSLSGNVIGNLNVTGNTASGNLLTVGLISATGNVDAGNLRTAGLISATANVTGGNLLTAGIISAAGRTFVASGTAAAPGITFSADTSQDTGFYWISDGNIGVTTNNGLRATFSTTGLSVVGNVTGGNIITAGLTTATGNLNTSAGVLATGNIRGGNVQTPGLITATGNITSTANVIGGNVIATTTMSAASYIGTTVSVTGNVAAANVVLNSTIAGAQGALVITATQGSPIHIKNSQATSYTEIGLYNNSNTIVGAIGAANPSTSVWANIGYHWSLNGLILNGNGASDSNKNLFINTSGIVTVPGTTAASSTTTGAMTVSGGVGVSGNIYVGGLVSATGNISGGNLNVTGNIVDTGALSIVTGSNGNIDLAPNGTGIVTASSSLSVTGNVTGGNIRTVGTVSATGDITTAGNINLTGNIVDSAALTISTSSGNLNLEPAGNIVLGNRYVNGVGYPVQDQDAASKYYVDLRSSTALAYHEAVVAATTDTLATTTGGTITYNQPNGVGNGVGATLTTTGTFNLIDTANVQTVGTRILVKNEANTTHNGIYVWSNATVITRSTDADEYGPDDAEQLSINDYFFVTGGNVNLGSAWVVDQPTGTITFGTSNIVFAQFSQSQVYSANTSAGLSLTGQTFSAKVDNNTTAFDGGNIIVKTGANLTTPNIGAATGTSLSTTGNITSTANISGGNILGNGRNLTGINTFSSIAVTGSDTITANSIATALTFTGDTSIVITANATTNTVSFAFGGSGESIFATGGDMGLVTEAPTATEDLGLITDAVVESYDLGTIVTSGVIVADALIVPTYTVTTLPPADPAAQVIFVSNESGGAVLAFSDGTNWRRCTDRAIVT